MSNIDNFIPGIDIIKIESNDGRFIMSMRRDIAEFLSARGDAVIIGPSKHKEGHLLVTATKKAQARADQRIQNAIQFKLDEKRRPFLVANPAEAERRLAKIVGETEIDAPPERRRAINYIEMVEYIQKNRSKGF